MSSSSYAELESYAGPGAYLICARRPWPTGRHPRHYCGSAVDVAARMKTHRKARPGRARYAKLIALFNQAGHDWDAVRLWKTANCRRAEIALKKRHRLANCCPRCNPSGWQRCGLLAGLITPEPERTPIR